MQGSQSAIVDSDSEAPAGTKTQQFLATAKKRFKICVDSSAKIRELWLEDVKFINGEQWLDAMLKERADDRRPALTINRLPASHNQVVNDFRQNRPSIKVRPVDSLSDPDKADVINGLFRRIQNNGDSKTAIDTAFYYATAGGFGFIRVKTDYCTEKSFDQDILLERIENPCTVYFPIDLCSQPDYSDANWCFVRVRIPKDEFKDKYPNADPMHWNDQGAGDPTWTTKDFVYVAEYFRIDEEEANLVLFSDGSTEVVSDSVKEGDIIGDEGFQLEVIKTRKTTLRKVYRSLITEYDILEPEELFPGKWIPIVPMLAQEVNVDGNKQYISLTRFAKDPQKMYNFWSSAFTEQVALAPRAPWIAAEGQIEGYENIWKQANNKNVAYLPYHPISAGGVMVPRPERNDPPQVGTAIITGLQLAADNIKATTGIFDASLGNQGNETSGRAINARMKQGATGNFHFADNAGRTLRHVGRIIKDMIPIIYDKPERVIRIVGEDMQDKVVEINKTSPDGETLYDLSIGDYDVIVDIGPSYETKRMEMTETLTALAQANPAFGQAAPDLLVQNLDFAGRDDLTKRMKKFVSMTMPGLIEQEQGEGGQPGEVTPEQAMQMQQQIQQDQQQLEQMQGTIQQLDQIVQKLQSEIDSKDKELQNKMDIEQIRAQVQMLKTEAEIQKVQMVNQHNMTKHASELAVKIHASDRQSEQGENEPSESGRFSEENSIEG